jgi:hypothetical protein
VNEPDWLKEETRPQFLVNHLRDEGKAARTKVGRRKLRLFACGCCRLIWDRLTDPRLRAAVEVAERFADGQSSQAELATAYTRVRGLAMGEYLPEAPGVEERTAAGLAIATTVAKPMSAAFGMTFMPVPLAGYRVGDRGGNAILCALIRCVFGNPFRPAALDPAWARTASGAVAGLAAAIYQERAFDRLPVLADALEEAGCTDAQLLGHLRGPGPHARGCWVLDQLLGRT